MLDHLKALKNPVVDMSTRIIVWLLNKSIIDEELHMSGYWSVSKSFVCMKTHKEVLRGRRTKELWNLQPSSAIFKLSEGQKIHPEVEEN